MRVLLAITKGETGGAQEHLRILAEGLSARGHDAAVLVEEPSDLAFALEQLGVKVLCWSAIRAEVRPLHDIRARAQLASAAKRFRADILHLHSSKAGIIGRGLRSGLPTIFTCHHASFGPGRLLRNRIAARPIEQVTLRRLDGIITVGARDMPLLRKFAPKVPIALIRNAVPLSEHARSPDSPVRTALWVARMQHPKDPLQAIKAWEAVVRQYSDASLILCGGGPLAGTVERAVNSSKVRDSIRYEGRVADLAPYYGQASVYLLASAAEGGTTIATLESMAQGLVPVVSDVGDAFLLEHAQCGIVVARGSARALAGGVASLFSDEGMFRAMRGRAIAFARENWSVDDMVDATESFYSEILRRHRWGG